jgi:diguanylate cyclase (GGDEF)-like protein
MPANKLPILDSLHVAEVPAGMEHQSQKIDLDRINLNLGHLAETGKFPSNELHDAYKQKSYESTHDSLTGLLNRSGFEMACERIMAAEPDHKRAVIFIDFDGFKKINDTQGHEKGDKLLKGVASRWANSFMFRKNEVFARLGGDEFVFLADLESQGDNKVITHGDIEKDNERNSQSYNSAIQAAISLIKRQAVEAGEIAELPFRGVSAGAAIYEPGLTLDQVKDIADASMYVDKAARNKAQVEASMPATTEVA